MIWMMKFKTISDYAEKQAREDVAKQEIVAASERIKEIRDKYGNEKIEASNKKFMNMSPTQYRNIK